MQLILNHKMESGSNPVTSTMQKPLKTQRFRGFIIFLPPTFPPTFFRKYPKLLKMSCLHTGRRGLFHRLLRVHKRRLCP